MTRCAICGKRVPTTEVEVIATAGGSGRAVRCIPCGNAARERITAANLARFGKHE